MAIERTHAAERSKLAERVRVLHVIPQLRPGGTEHALLRLIRGLGEEAFEHRICATRGFDPEFAGQHGVSEKLVVAGRFDEAFQFPLFRLTRIIRAFKPHVVHSRNWGGIEAIVAARLCGVPNVIHSEHGYEVDSLEGMPLRRRLFRRAVYPMTDAVFTNTRELRDYHSKQAWTRCEKIRVIQNGVDTARFSPQPGVRLNFRKELGFSDDCLVLGSVGRLVAIKDHRTLLKSAALLVARGIDVRVLLVGAGPEMATLQCQAQETQELAGHVSFLGASDQVAALMNAMDVFVLPSLGEGMSNTILEAMASALPVVATRVGGNTELIDDGRNGFLFSPGDAAGLANIIEQKLRDAVSRFRFGVAARQKAATQFSLERMIARYRDLYVGLAARRDSKATALSHDSIGSPSGAL